MTRPAQLPAAVILGGDVNGLGVARSLAGQGIPLFLVDTDPKRDTMRTRHGRKVTFDSLSGVKLLNSLKALRKTFSQIPVLIPTQEASVETLASNYAAVSTDYHLPFGAPSMVRDLQDKTQFQAMAESLGFSVPRARALQRGLQKSDLDALHFPCVVKPATKDPAYGMSFAKAYRVETSEQAVDLWTKMQTIIDTAIIQEWIEGDDSSVYFCLQYRAQNGPVTSYCGRKTLQWPPLLGGTATCIPAPEVHSTLSRITSDFFATTGLTGLCSMEYKHDINRQRFYMIEPTVGRTDYQEEIATLNGVNIPLAAYCDLTGLNISAGATATPLGWRDFFNYQKAVAAGARDAAPGIASSLKITDAHFRLDDPLPYLSARLAPLRRRLGFS